MHVLATSGTGDLGRTVVTQLRSRGRPARVLTRNLTDHVDAVQGNLITVAGLIKAVADVDPIIHAASATTQLTKSQSIDMVGTRPLLAMARESGVSHVVYVSTVGMEGVNHPLGKAKLAAEAIVQQNNVPWSILRAIQFHALTEAFLKAFSRPPFVSAVPFKWRFQPVDASEVAARLVEVVAEKPAGRLPDFGGPRLESSRASPSRGSKRASSECADRPALPFKFSRQFATGCLLAPDHMDGKITFEQYLEEKDPT